MRGNENLTHPPTTPRNGNTRFMAPHTAIALAGALSDTDPGGVSAVIERAADEMTLSYTSSSAVVPVRGPKGGNRRSARYDLCSSPSAPSTSREMHWTTAMPYLVRTTSTIRDNPPSALIANTSSVLTVAGILVVLASTYSPQTLADRSAQAADSPLLLVVEIISPAPPLVDLHRHLLP